MAALICVLACTGTCDHLTKSLIMLFDPQNIGLDTIFVQLSAILDEI